MVRYNFRKLHNLKAGTRLSSAFCPQKTSQHWRESSKQTTQVSQSLRSMSLSHFLVLPLGYPHFLTLVVEQVFLDARVIFAEYQCDHLSHAHRHSVSRKSASKLAYSEKPSVQCESACWWYTWWIRSSWVWRAKSLCAAFLVVWSVVGVLHRNREVGVRHGFAGVLLILLQQSIGFFFHLKTAESITCLSLGRALDLISMNGMVFENTPQCYQGYTFCIL